MSNDKQFLPDPSVLLERMFEGAPEFLVVLDADLNITLSGESFRKTTGVEKDKTVSFLDTVERFSLTKVRETFEELRSGGSEHHTLEINHRTAESGSIYIRYSWVACMDASGTCRGFVGIGREPQMAETKEDVAGLKGELEALTSRLERRTKEIARLRKELEVQVSQDDLTGLHNRKFLLERLEIEAARAVRYDQPLTLVLLDVDRMTHVNDEYGQEKGDEVILEVSKVIQEQVRQTDLAGRYGGEEFMILCPHTDRPSAQFLAERLRRRVAEISFETKDDEFGVTISLGLVTVSAQNEFDVEAILHAAEQALESAKVGGMNRVRVLEVT